MMPGSFYQTPPALHPSPHLSPHTPTRHSHGLQSYPLLETPYIFGRTPSQDGHDWSALNHTGASNDYNASNSNQGVDALAELTSPSSVTTGNAAMSLVMRDSNSMAPHMFVRAHEDESSGAFGSALTLDHAGFIDQVSAKSQDLSAQSNDSATQAIDPRLTYADQNRAFSPWLVPVFSYDFLRKDQSYWQGDSDGQCDVDMDAAPIYAPHQGFGNLALASAIDANHYPLDVQLQQKNSLFAPLWGARTLTDPEAPDDPIAGIFLECVQRLRIGMSAEEVCGSHVFVEALHDQAAYDRAPLLSQLMARLVKSVKPAAVEPSFTMYALMWFHWALFRWMLAPSPQSYADLPPVARPTPWQLFRKHWLVVDFTRRCTRRESHVRSEQLMLLSMLLDSPVLREHICRTQSLELHWMASACATIACDWDRSPMEALCRNGSTGALDLNPIAKSRAGLHENWSLGPSLGRDLSNARDFWRIRDTDEEQ